MHIYGTLQYKTDILSEFFLKTANKTVLGVFEKIQNFIFSKNTQGVGYFKDMTIDHIVERAERVKGYHHII